MCVCTVHYTYMYYTMHNSNITHTCLSVTLLFVLQILCVSKSVSLCVDIESADGDSSERSRAGSEGPSAIKRSYGSGKKKYVFTLSILLLLPLYTCT